ncbi:hypothetical protein [Pararhizobium sp. IMCC21322]
MRFYLRSQRTAGARDISKSGGWRTFLSIKN